MQQVTINRNFESWRTAARALIADRVSPIEVVWVEVGSELLNGFARPALAALQGTSVAVPREFVDLARLVACHRDSDRWSLLYRLLWRIAHEGDRQLLERVTDDAVSRAFAMEKAVRRDRHKMTAFVRFRKVVDERNGEHFVAWHRPDHYIVRLTAPFFVKRFGSMRWSILTPDDSVSWDGETTRFGPGVPASAAPKPDELEDLWRTYYANIFNPARIKLKAMRREMPVRHWPTLPETQIIDELLRAAPKRVEEMMAKKTEEYPTAAAFLPERITLPQLREAAAGCKGCPLYKMGTQTVFGEGPKEAPLMFIGEQPGDQEDLAGKPFIGPAGQVFDDALKQAGIDRGDVYVTNAVKHFKWEPRGTRRIHSKPSSREVQACKPWLTAEVQVVKPSMIVCLGATAAGAVMGPAFRLTQHRGEVFSNEWAKWVLATVHPSSLLRIPDPAGREEAKALFVKDLKQVAKALKGMKKN